MSKAENLAKKLYPDWEVTGVPKIDGQEKSIVRIQRAAYVKGYHQAENDLELNVEDVELICEIEFSIVRSENGLPSKEAFYKEILERYKNLKKLKED